MGFDARAGLKLDIEALIGRQRLEVEVVQRRRARRAVSLTTFKVMRRVLP